MIRDDIDVYDLFRPLMDEYGGFDVYELTAGTLNLSDGSLFNLSYPAYYITNITLYALNSTDFQNGILQISNELHPMFYNKESFLGGVVTISFVLCGIVTASWMLFLLLFLASNTIPNSLILTNLFFSVGHSVMLTKLTSILKCQYVHNYSDMDEIKKLISFGTSFLTVRAITTLLIWVSWVDIMVQISKYSYKKQIIIWGAVLSICNFVVRLIYGLMYTKHDHDSSQFKGIKALHFLFDYLMLIIFTIQVARYSFKKKKFAYHRKAIALAIFSWITLIVPFIFATIDLCSDTLRTWSTYIFSFSVFCVIVVIWEWIHTIRTLELKYERKAVLGRRISNDSFLEDPMNPNLDPKHRHNNGYILKSINIFNILSSLKGYGGIKKKISNPRPSRNRFDQPEDVSFYEMVDDLSRQTSYQGSALSFDDGAHPEFNVDHRYLRNTPSTFAGSRATPTTNQVTFEQEPLVKNSRKSRQSNNQSNDNDDDDNDVSYNDDTNND